MIARRNRALVAGYRRGNAQTRKSRWLARRAQVESRGRSLTAVVVVLSRERVRLSFARRRSFSSIRFSLTRTTIVANHCRPCPTLPLFSSRPVLSSVSASSSVSLRNADKYLQTELILLCASYSDAREAILQSERPLLPRDVCRKCGKERIEETRRRFANGAFSRMHERELVPALIYTLSAGDNNASLQKREVMTM